MFSFLHGQKHFTVKRNIRTYSNVVDYSNTINDDEKIILQNYDNG